MDHPSGEEQPEPVNVSWWTARTSATSPEALEPALPPAGGPVKTVVRASRKRLAVLAALAVGGVTLALALTRPGSSGPSASGLGTTEPGTPAPTLADAPLDEFRYDQRAWVGGSFTPIAHLARSVGQLKIVFSGLADYARLTGCSPACEVTVTYGSIFATFDRAAGGWYSFYFTTTKTGVANWDACIYADGAFVKCGAATTTISRSEPPQFASPLPSGTNAVGSSGRAP